MENPTVGHVPCPFCGASAPVKRERKGRALYYRCYEGPHGSCGTIQCRGPGGQRWINANMTPLEPAEREAEADAAAETARGEQRAAARDVERQRERSGGIAAAARRFRIPEGAADE